MKSLETAQIVGIASVMLAATALALNLLWNRRSRREASIRDRRSFNAEFRRWADLVVTAMSLALHQWQRNEPITTELLAEVSALLNRGRLFFLNPNQEHNRSSLEFPGLRPRMLDCIYFTYRFLQLPRDGRDLSADWDTLFRLQARFVRDSQTVMALETPRATMEDLDVLLRSPEFLNTKQNDPAIVAAIAEINR